MRWSRQTLTGACLASLLCLGCSVRGGGSYGQETQGDADVSKGEADILRTEGHTARIDPDTAQIGPDITLSDVDDTQPETRPPSPEGTAGCGADPSGIATVLEVQGKSRSFALSVPDSYDASVAYPLVFAWHGLGGFGALAMSYFGLQSAAGSEAIIVYPDALPHASLNGQTGWTLSPYDDDFAFFDALYLHLTEGLCVDAERVFATGHSFGGYMSNSLGCYRSEVLDAIAPVAGGPPAYGGCGAPIGVWLTHGSADATVVLSEGKSALARWRTTNGCSAESEDTSPSPCVAYKGCARELHWCEHTGGHEWPDFAPGAIWDFFASQ